MKNKFLVFCLGFLITFFTSACSNAQPDVNSKQQNIAKKKILIVYLSRTKNTKAVAEMIYKNIGGDLVELEVKNPYPTDYKLTVEQVSRELNSGFLPPLKTKINNIESYDLVFIGFPTWSMQLPPPIKSFLKTYNLKGKTVIPFNTNAGYGIGSSFETVKELSSGSKHLEGYSTKGGVERDNILYIMEGEKYIQVEKQVKDWLKKIELL
ncbi:flavodoxin family protein [Pedobacter sp.]|uniref:flavodoxin family protein n=1 Tax=Pedobacter sp. TaxID=1411316 RepID=UPI003BAB139D